MSPVNIALAISIAINLALGWLSIHEAGQTATATSQRDQARGLASACSDATDDLRTVADKRAAEARAANLKAAKAADGHYGKADAILSAPATAPADDCKSAGDRRDTWWNEGAAP